jgi:hypothetical protein
MILNIAFATPLFLDQQAKRVVERAFSAATEITRMRVTRASKGAEASSFEDSEDCGSDLISEAERSKTE